MGDRIIQTMDMLTVTKVYVLKERKIKIKYQKRSVRDNLFRGLILTLEQSSFF